LSQAGAFRQEALALIPHQRLSTQVVRLLLRFIYRHLWPDGLS
jgi:hypothetical protein